MVISLPIPEALKKETTEKLIEIRIPTMSNILMNNKYVNAFKQVLSAPVK